MKSYWEQRYSRVSGLRTVGSLSRSEAENQGDYRESRARLAELLRTDFPALDEVAVLEVGYGRGYDARLLHELGVRRYVGIDFVAPRPDNLPDELETKTLSFAERQDLGRTFPLVLVLDVAFHVVDDEEFHVFVDNVARHASKRVYLTGLFRDARIAPHVRHRPLSAFASLGRALDIHPWRDTMLVRFERT